LNARAEASMVVVRRLDQLVGGRLSVLKSRVASPVRAVRAMRRLSTHAAPRPMPKAEEQFPLTDTGETPRF
jgi:hypothetical protein